MEPRLYIVMREDLWDMNPGKGMAQAAHAQADFDAYMVRYARSMHVDKVDLDSALLNAYQHWKADRTFGTTTVLTQPLEDFTFIVNGVDHYGMITDPTYPYRNYYKQVFTRSEITCMWVFAINEREIEYMKQYRLHP